MQEPATGPKPAVTSGARAGWESDQRQAQVRAEQVRLLYENAVTGIGAALIVATLLAYCQWDVIPHVVVSMWLLYVVVVSAARLLLVRGYWRASPSVTESRGWGVAFAVGAGIAAAGWAAAGIMLYPPAQPTSQILLVFVLGGIMLGGASLLAARPEAFLTFLLPTGLLPAIRLASEGDEEHLTMGLLAAVFTVATLSTTWRFHMTIESSLRLRFENQDLVESLQVAKNQTDQLNRDLELRVGERTAKLREADQRKDEFLATLAHELRNPLAPIRFAVEGLKTGAPPGMAARAHDVIERQVGQLVRLVDDLLDVSRITANKIHLRREPHALSRLMTIAVESIMPLARAADHQIEVALPSPSVLVDGDGTRLVQVFANVLNNAVKFTPPGGHIWFTRRPAVPRGGGAHPRYRDRHRPRYPAARVRHVPAGGADPRTIQRWPGHRALAGAAARGDARGTGRHPKPRHRSGDGGRDPSADRDGSGRGPPSGPNRRPLRRHAASAC